MNFSINNKLCFLDSFQFISLSLDRLVKNLSKDDFKYLSHEFDNNVLDLVKQKDFILMNIWVILKKLVTANMNMFLMFGKNLKWKRWTVIMIFIYVMLYLCDVLLLGDIFEIFRNDSIKLWIMSKSLLERTSLKLGWNI